MTKTGTSLVLMLIVAAVIVCDQALEAPWRYGVWGLGMALPWIVVSRLSQK